MNIEEYILREIRKIKYTLKCNCIQENNLPPTYANNTAALAGGLVEGQKYYLPVNGDNYVLAVVKSP